MQFTRLMTDRRIEQAVTFDSDDPAYAGQMRITWTFEPVAEGTVVSPWSVMLSAHVSTTMIYTHVLNRGGMGVESPADLLGEPRGW